MKEGGERDRARNDRLTVQKKNAVCCRNGEKVPKGERHTVVVERKEEKHKR